MPRENQSELRRKIYPIIVGKNFAVEVSYMEKMKYKMSSRATILLGRESVSRVDGAIIELVKNTYDADAGFCFICFDVEHDHIYILDNGSGMTKGIIESCWMLIGTDTKMGVPCSKLLGWCEKEIIPSNCAFLGWLADEDPFVIGNGYNLCFFLTPEGKVIASYRAPC